MPGKQYISPIQRFIRHAFQQNRGDTSPRLVLAALNAGYKFLDLLDAAKIAGSPSHKSVVEALERRPPPKRPPPPLRTRDERAAKRAKKKAMKEQGISAADKQEKRRHPPIITRRVIPGTEQLSPDGTVITHLYDYVPTEGPRPLSELPGGVENGRRRVPRLVTEATGIPFLRLGKPQSPILSRALRFKIAKRRERTLLASNLMKDDAAFAEEEDIWEFNLARALTEAGGPGAKEFAESVAREPTYRSSVVAGAAHLNRLLNLETADMLLRSRAYLQIVDRERDLAEKEEKERQARKQAQAKEEKEVV
ncbi:MAG: E2 ubiquitin-conjugating protein mms2 [Sporothrix thermara]